MLAGEFLKSNWGEEWWAWVVQACLLPFEALITSHACFPFKKTGSVGDYGVCDSACSESSQLKEEGESSEAEKHRE